MNRFGSGRELRKPLHTLLGLGGKVCFVTQLSSTWRTLYSPSINFATNSMGYKVIEQRIRTGDHLCSFYENQTEQYQIALPFLAEGLHRGEKCLYIADENTTAEIAAGLLLHDVDVERYLQTGQLVIVTPKETYLRGGRFAAEQMISLLTSYAADAVAHGYSAFRAAGEVTWLLREFNSLDAFLEYEDMLNDAMRGLPVKILCQYNTKKFLGDVIVRVLKTHPRVLLGLELYENPFHERATPHLGHKPPAQSRLKTRK